MRVRKGCSFEVHGTLRKESVEVGEDDYPIAADLEPLMRATYLGWRAEQLLLVLRWQAGGIDDETYSTAYASLETLASGIAS